MIKKVCGLMMILSIFVALFIIGSIKHGMLITMGVFVICALIISYLYVAVGLIFD